MTTGRLAIVAICAAASCHAAGEAKVDDAEAARRYAELLLSVARLGDGGHKSFLIRPVHGARNASRDMW